MPSRAYSSSSNSNTCWLKKCCSCSFARLGRWNEAKKWMSTWYTTAQSCCEPYFQNRKYLKQICGDLTSKETYQECQWWIQSKLSLLRVQEDRWCEQSARWIVCRREPWQKHRGRLLSLMWTKKRKDKCIPYAAPTSNSFLIVSPRVILVVHWCKLGISEQEFDHTCSDSFSCEWSTFNNSEILRRVLKLSSSTTAESWSSSPVNSRLP